MYEFLDRRYALALYEIANEKGTVKEFLEQLEEVHRVMDECEDMDVILDHPNIGGLEKKKLFMSIWEKTLHKEVLNFLFLLIEKERIKFLYEKIQQYKLIMLEAENTINIKVESAIELRKRQEERLIDILRKKTNKEVVIDKKINKSLIAGYTIKYEDIFIDYSLRNSLDRLIQGGEENAY